MDFFQKNKNKILVVALVVLLILAGTVHFFKTPKGGSYVLYFVGAWHAPWSVKFECANANSMTATNKLLIKEPTERIELLRLSALMRSLIVSMKNGAM